MSLLQVIPLGGCGEIGKNCTAVVQGDDIILIDCGLSFPHEELLGVDIVIPDFTWVLENADKVRGIFLTHAHEDHIGALAYLLPDLDVPVYCTRFCEALLRQKLADRARGLEPDLRIFEPGNIVEAGELSVEPVRVTHSIPETCALAVRTEHGIVLFTADFKFDNAPIDKQTSDTKRLAELGEEGVLLLMSDSTNVDQPGWSESESAVGPTLHTLLSESPGRVILTTFSSNIHRMQQVINAAHETGRKVAVAGRRMDQTLSLCQAMGYVKIPDGVYIRLDHASQYKPEELVILATGSQGEPKAALSQMSHGEYRRLRFQEGDTVIYSARAIPGNEGAIWRKINRMVMLGVHVIVDHPTPIHVSGHAHEEEIKMMLNLTKPFYVAPVHGEARHQKHFEDLLLKDGHPAHRIFVLQNGEMLHIDKEKAWTEFGAPSGEVLFDQSGSIIIESSVIHERTQLAHDGVIVAAVNINFESGELLERPTLTARGFCGTEDHLNKATNDLVAMLDGLHGGEMADRATLEDQITACVKRTISRVSRQRPSIIAAVGG
jgi:ribonuclease J